MPRNFEREKKNTRYRKRRGKDLNPKQKQQVKKIINRVVPVPEEKAVAVTYVALGTIDNNAGEAYTIIGPTGGPGGNWSLGSAYNQRIGSQIYVKKVIFTWAHYIPQLSYGTSYRVIMFVDSQGTETTSLFTPTEPLMNGVAGAGLTILSAYNNDTVGPGKRYNILHDKMYKANITSGGDADQANQYTVNRLTHTFPFKGMKCLLNPADPVAGTNICVGNQIYIWFVAAGVVTGAPPDLHNTVTINELRSCVYYTDA